MVTLIYEQGTIISINFDPSTRHEPAGRHYGVIISPWEINRISSLTLVAPITSTDNGFPLHVPIAEGNEIYGFVQCEALESLDLGARELNGSLKIVGELDDSTLAKVFSTILVVMGLEEI